jgi:hypothetical protein
VAITEDWATSRYWRITALSKMAHSPTLSVGVLHDGNPNPLTARQCLFRPLMFHHVTTQLPRKRQQDALSFRIGT